MPSLPNFQVGVCSHLQHLGWTGSLVYRYIAVEATTRYINPWLGQCWYSVYDAGPTLTQPWVDVLWLPGEETRHPSTQTDRPPVVSTSYCQELARNYQENSGKNRSAVQSQKAVNYQFKSKQLLPFGFAWCCVPEVGLSLIRRTVY